MSEQPKRLAEAAIATRFDNGRILIEAAQRAFLRAAEQAVAENDRLGVITHGGKDGKIVEQRPVLKSAKI